MEGFMRARTVFAVLAGIVFLSVSSAAEAHFDLTMPPPADTAADGGKGAPPCGPTTASNVVTPVQGGHPITVALDETLMHPGWYRIALSINSRSELPADPTVTVVGGNSTNAAYQDPAVFPVLADHVFVHTSGTAPLHYSMSVMLPNVTCAKCTLQVIEFMNMHGPNPGGGYFYHHCADLMITADPNLPDGGSTAGTAGTTGTTGAAGTTGTAGAAGTTGTTGAAGTGTGAGGSSGNAPGSSGGGCALSGSGRNAGAIGSLFLLAILLRRRRRR
jgi:hypothetical protein